MKRALLHLTGKDLHAIISSRVTKELKTVSQFVWAAIVYQIILYSFLTHTLIRHLCDMQIMLLCVAGEALYIPLTVALIRRVRTLYRRPSEWPGSTVPYVFHKVEGEYAGLADFFQFKKRMDWIGVPVSCAIIVLVTFKLSVEGGVEGNPLAGLAFFALWVGMSLTAIHAENRKRFVSPLQHLKQVLDDLKSSLSKPSDGAPGVMFVQRIDLPQQRLQRLAQLPAQSGRQFSAHLRRTASSQSFPIRLHQSP